MIKVPSDETEAEALLEMLKVTNGKTISEMDLPVLREVFLTTAYSGLRDAIADTLVEAEDEGLYPILIKKIKDVIHTRYVGNLIYAASSFDCSDDIQLFIDLLILKDDICFMQAFYVLPVMDSIDDDERQYALNKLHAYLNTLNSEHPKFTGVSDAIKVLEYPTTC